MAALSSGKLVNLMRLADAAGRFRMLAIDQRDSLRAALARATGRQPEEVGPAEMAEVKTLVTEILAPHSSAVLVDPSFGWPDAVRVTPGDVGILVAVEETGYEPAGPHDRERRARLVEGWSVAKAKRAGANAAKLLIHYSPEAGEDVREHQRAIVRETGEACAREDLPFLLELVTYPVIEPAADTPEFARKRPDHMIAAAREFSNDAYRVDILKLEFPGDLKYTRPHNEAGFDGKRRPAVFDLDDLRGFCRELNAAAQRPWVILSGGVGIDEFLVALDLAAEAGASGFLCGRAIWQEALPLFPDRAAMRTHLKRTAVENLTRAGAVADGARPWFAHPRFGGWDQVRLEDAGEHWYLRYGAGAGLSEE